MKSKTAVGLQALLWMVCVFHVGMGAGLNISPSFVEPAARMYGAVVAEWSPQFLYIVRPLGVFMLALGIFAGAAAVNPSKNRLAIYVFAGIFIIRALQRLLLGSEVNEVFGIESSRNFVNMLFFFGLAAALIVLDALNHRPAAARESAAA